MSEKTEQDKALADALNYGTGYTMGGEHVPVEQVATPALYLWLDRIERIAFNAPPPNQYTPQIVSATNAARIFAAKTIDDLDEARTIAWELADALERVEAAAASGDEYTTWSVAHDALTRARKAGYIGEDG